MKRIALSLIIFAALLMTACSDSLESMAKKRYKNYAKEIVDPENKFASLDFYNEKVTFSGDSICIIHFSLDRTNYTGETETENFEYLLLYNLDTPASLHEIVYTIGERKALQDFVANFNTEEQREPAIYEHTLRVMSLPLYFLNFRKVE